MVGSGGATATRREGEAPVESRRRAALPRQPVGERRGSFSRGVVGVERGGRERWCGRINVLNLRLRPLAVVFFNSYVEL